MLATLRRFTILQRLIFMLVLAAIGTFVFGSFSINEQRNSLIAQKWIQNDAQLSTVLSLLDAHNDSAQQGIITQEDAQKAAQELVNHIKYGTDGFFILFDKSQVVIANGASPKRTIERQ